VYIKGLQASFGQTFDIPEIKTSKQHLKLSQTQMAVRIHPTIGNTSWALPLRISQFVFAVLVMSLSAYTLSKITSWREVRFTVAAVPTPS
jgi:hypothetical protein